MHINGQLSAEYRYNGFGERIKKVVYHHSKKPTVTYYLYDGNQLTAEAGEDGKITAQYLYLGHAPVAKLEGRRIYAIHSDHLGTPRAATDQDANLVWSADYSPFGRARVHNSNTITLNLRFPGQYEDEASGFHYNYFRDYDPETGRYLTSDPIGLNGGFNLYGYVDNKPINFTDRFGLACDQRGCWLTDEEQRYIQNGNYEGYYNAACDAGDNYACMAVDVAMNNGILPGITNWRLANSIQNNLPAGMDCEESYAEVERRMEKIRVELAQAHGDLTGDGSEGHPIMITRQQFSDFHNEVFSENGAGAVFGGDIPVFGNWPLKWCEPPGCEP